MRSALALASAVIVAAGLWAALPAQASTSVTKWPHWNPTVHTDLVDACPLLTTNPVAAAATFGYIPSDQGLKGKTKAAFIRVEKQLQAGNVAPAVHLCALANVAATPATTTTTTAPKPIFFQTGSGQATTMTFTVPASWDLVWTYDCSNFGDSGNFQVYVYGSDGTLDFQANGPNQLGPNGKGTEYYHADPGSKYLEVNSECDWSVLIPPA